MCLNGSYPVAGRNILKYAANVGVWDDICAVGRSARRALAAAWFAILVFLVTTVLFLHQPMVFRGRFLLVLLPTTSSGVAGYILGGAILDSTKTKGCGESLLRGIRAAGGAFATFALLFVFRLWQTEPGSGTIQVGGLFLATLTFGLFWWVHWS